MHDSRDRAAYLLLGRLGYLVGEFAKSPEGIHRDILEKLARAASDDYEAFRDAGVQALASRT